MIEKQKSGSNKILIYQNTLNKKATHYVQWVFWACHSNDISLRNVYGVN